MELLNYSPLINLLHETQYQLSAYEPFYATTISYNDGSISYFIPNG